MSGVLRNELFWLQAHCTAKALCCQVSVSKGAYKIRSCQVE